MKNSLRIVCPVLVLATGVAVGDEIYVRGSATPNRGEITGVSKIDVTIKAPSGPAKEIPANTIRDVRWEGEPPALRLARAAEVGGNYQRALDDYGKMLEDIPSSRADLRRDMQFLIARATAGLAFGDPSKADEAIEKLETFRKENPENFRYYATVDLLGRLYMAQRKDDLATQLLDELERAPWNDHRMAAQSAKARLLLLKEDVDGALAAFDRVASSSAQSPAEQARHYEALLGKAHCLSLKNQHDECIQALDEVIEKIAAEETRVQAAAYLRKGDALQALGKTKEAVLAYLHVDVLFPQEKELHPEALFHLAKLGAAVGQPEAAADARAALESDYPNSDWFRRLTGN